MFMHLISSWSLHTHVSGTAISVIYGRDNRLHLHNYNSTRFIFLLCYICIKLNYHFVLHIYRFIYETEQFNGVGELLEILGR